MPALLNSYLGSLLRTLQNVLYDIKYITNNNAILSSSAYPSFQNTVCQILMEILAQVQDSDVVHPNVYSPGTTINDAFSVVSHYPSIESASAPLMSYPYSGSYGIHVPPYSIFSAPFQLSQPPIPVAPPVGLTSAAAPILSVPILGMSDSRPLFSPPGLHKDKEENYTNGSSSASPELTPMRAKTPTYGYIEINFTEGVDQKQGVATPKTTSSLPGSPFRPLFSPGQRISLSPPNPDLSKAKLEDKHKKAEQRRLSYLESRNSKVKKELDDVLSKTEQIRKQIANENYSLYMQVIERQARAQSLRESQLSAVQESAKSSIQKVALASQRRAQCAEETMKSLKARHELINSRREAFNKRIIEKALSSSTRHREGGRGGGGRDSKESSPQLTSNPINSMFSSNNELTYRRVETIWPPSAYSSVYTEGAAENSKLTMPLQDVFPALVRNVEAHKTVTPSWVRIRQQVVGAIEKMLAFYVATPFPLREYSLKIIHRAEKTMHEGGKQGEGKDNMDTQYWIHQLLTWFNSKYKLKDAYSAESVFSDTVTVIGHDHSEVHMYSYMAAISIAAVTPNFVHKCIAAAQEVITAFERDTYSKEEMELLFYTSIIVLFFVSSYLRFSIIFYGQCCEHAELKSIYALEAVPANEITRYLTKTPGICKEALMYSLMLVALRILKYTSNEDRAQEDVLESLFGDGFILNGIATRISLPIIPAVNLLAPNDSPTLGMAIVHDNFSTVQQGLRIIINCLASYEDDEYSSYFINELPTLCKAVISCLSQLLLSSSSFISHSKEKKNFCPRPFTRHSSESVESIDLTSSQLLSRRTIEDYILAVDLQSIVAECFVALAYISNKYPSVLADILSTDEILQLEVSHSLSVLPLPGALFADEPSQYINAHIPYCIAFPRYHIVSSGANPESPASYGVSSVHCTQSNAPTLNLSILKIMSAPQVVFHANAYPYEAMVHDYLYKTVSPALLCGLIFLKHALQTNHKAIMQIVSFAEDPVVLRSVATSLPVECFIDRFLRNKLLAPIFQAAKEYSSALSNDVPDDMFNDELTDENVPTVASMLLPLI